MSIFHLVVPIKLSMLNNTSSVQESGATCRCEYPGEQLYNASTSSSGTYLTVGETVVFPSSHPACVELWFICPDVELLGTIPWTYECPTTEQNGARRMVESIDDSRKSQHLERGDPNVRSNNPKAGIQTNEFISEFHRLVDDGKEYYTLLPEEFGFCKNGGQRIRSGDTSPTDCTARILSFNKAGDRRPLPGGTSVSNEWFPNLGVKITATSDGGPDNMYPIVFDMANPDTNGVDSKRASLLGSHDELGNVLLPLRPHGAAGVVADDYGMLNFDFYEKTFVNYVTLLNVDNISKIFVTQADGNFSFWGMESAGAGGIQTVDIGLDNVIRLTVSFKTFAAVVSMDLCIVKAQQ